MPQLNPNSHAAATARKKEGKSQLALIIYNTNDSLLTEFFVEAKPKRRWTTVGGPFSNRSEADTFARDYAIEHNVTTRVVAYQ